ncbi:MAG: AfsR/SARP family transcriptional regulator [Nocardioidaceae bacterium]
MSTALTLLSGVRWNGRPIAGERPQALLAALVTAGGRAVSNERLVTALWGDHRPADRVKALQVLVSRVRAATCADLVVRDLNGYRLGVRTEQVDALALKSAVDHAAGLFREDAHAAREAADRALALADGVVEPAPEDVGPLGAVRREGAATAATARLLRARADCRLGRHADALMVLEAVQAERSDDDSLLADLLHSEAAVDGGQAELFGGQGVRGLPGRRTQSSPRLKDARHAAADPSTAST